MHWEWIVPVIALAMWIISSLIRGAEEQAKGAQRPGGLPGGEPLRRQPSEVDKFLEEINRMRRRQAEEQRQAPPRTEPARPTVVQIPEVVPVEERAPNFEQTRPAAVNPPVVVQPRPERQRPARPRPTEARPAAVQPAAVPVAPAPPAPAPRPMVVQRQTPVAPAVGQLYSLLRSRESVQAAILLHEVLGPPRCRRG